RDEDQGPNHCDRNPFGESPDSSSSKGLKRLWCSCSHDRPSLRRCVGISGFHSRRYRDETILRGTTTNRVRVADPRVSAEREGFDPPDPCGPTVFKTVAFVHSATAPCTRKCRSGA